jgi:hypothetical protein
VREPDEYQASRGIPFAIGDRLPEWLPERLKDTYAIRRLSRDLIYYGAVPTQPRLWRAGPRAGQDQQVKSQVIAESES